MENKKKSNVVRLNDLLNSAKMRSTLSKEVLKDSLHALLAAITENVNGGKVVVLDDFGKFDSRIVKEHTAMPPSHEPVVVPEHTAVRFKAFKNFLYYHKR